MIDIKRFFFRGSPLSMADRYRIDNLCQTMRLYNIYSFNSENCLYYIDEHNIMVKYESPRDAVITKPDLLTRAELGLKDFGNLLESYYKENLPMNWFWKLKPGETVEIAERVWNSEEYPYMFTDEMAAYAGQQFRISRMNYSNIGRNSSDRKTLGFNGDTALYYLEGMGFSWHSSMFINPDNTITPKLDIADFTVLNL